VNTFRLFLELRVRLSKPNLHVINRQTDGGDEKVTDDLIQGRVSGRGWWFST